MFKEVHVVYAGLVQRFSGAGIQRFNVPKETLGADQGRSSVGVKVIITAGGKLKVGGERHLTLVCLSSVRPNVAVSAPFAVVRVVKGKDLLINTEKPLC